MAKRIMSDAEIKRRKKVQGHISQAGGVIGLGALGGTLAASRGGRTMLRRIPKLESKIKPPKPKDPDRDKIKGAVAPLLATGAGLGGVGSFNFASYTGAESRKRAVAQPVKKELGMDMGYFSDEGSPLSSEEIEKAWEPLARNYDPEAKRHRRNKGYQNALEIGAAGAGGAGVGHAVRGAKKEKKYMSAQPRARNLPNVKAHRVEAVAHAKKAGKWGAAGAALAGGAAVVNHQRKGSWQSYGKRDTTSAFGVDHDPSGQHHETEN